MKRALNYLSSLNLAIALILVLPSMLYASTFNPDATSTTKAVQATNTYKIEAVTAAPGASGSLNIILENQDTPAAGQLDITYDSTIGLQIDHQAVQAVDRLTGFDVDVSASTTNPAQAKIRILFYNRQDLTITAGNSTILKVPYSLSADASGSTAFAISNVELVASDSSILDTGSVNGSLTVEGSTPPADSPEISSVQPNAAKQGETVNVTITGENTNFVNGTTTASFGTGITVNSVTVSSAAQAIANISVDNHAAVGTRTVTLTTGSESVSANNGFTVEDSPQTGAIIYVEDTPLNLNVDETYRLTIKVDPRTVPVNGVYIRGRIDPNYLELVAVNRDTSVLNSQIEPVQINKATGEFEYGAGVFNKTVTDTFPILYIDVKGKAPTPAAGVAVDFLDSYPPTDITGPNGSIMAEAQDGIIHVTNYAIIKGSVRLQGRSTTSAQDTKVETLKIELQSRGEITQTYTFSVTTDNYARFEIPGVPAGAYDISVKGEDTLDNLRENVTLKVGLGNVIDFGTLLEGDTNNDNFILIDDFGPIGDCYNKKVSDNPSCEQADLTEDSVISSSDFSYFSGNFERCGASEMESGQCVQTHLARVLPNERTISATASLSLNITDITTEVGQLHTITFTVEPNADPVNVVNMHYQFDPNLVEVVDFNMLTDVLDVPLDTPEESELENGMILASAGIIGDVKTEPFVIATMSVKLKAKTVGASITPISEFPATMISGPEGDVMESAEGVTLRASIKIFLPMVSK